MGYIPAGSLKIWAAIGMFRFRLLLIIVRWRIDRSLPVPWPAIFTKLGYKACYLAHCLINIVQSEFKLCFFIAASTSEAVPGASVGTTAWAVEELPSALIFTGKTNNCRAKRINTERGRLLPSLLTAKKQGKLRMVEDLQIEGRTNTHVWQTN